MTTTQIILTAAIVSFAASALIGRYLFNLAGSWVVYALTDGEQQPRHEQAQRTGRIRKSGDVETFIHGERK